MNVAQQISQYFEKQFADYERKRMYPPGYGKEGLMTKPKVKHCSAITRSIHLLEHGLSDDLEKRFHKAIERDLELLKDVKDMLYVMIENPTLPFVEAVSCLEAIELIPLADVPNEAF